MEIEGLRSRPPSEQLIVTPKSTLSFFRLAEIFKGLRAPQHELIALKKIRRHENATTSPAPIVTGSPGLCGKHIIIGRHEGLELAGRCYTFPTMPISPVHSQLWHSQIKDRLQDELEHCFRTERCHLEFNVVRDENGKIGPCILLTCWDENTCQSESGRESTRRQVQKKIRKLQSIQGCPFPCKVVIDSISLLSRASESDSSIGPKLQASLEEPLTTFVGLLVKICGSDSQECTLGGLVRIGSRVYGLTVAHPFSGILEHGSVDLPSSLTSYESDDTDDNDLEGSLFGGFETISVMETEIEGTEIEGTEIEGTEIEGTEIEGTEIEGTEIEGTEIEGTEIEGSDPNSTMDQNLDSKLSIKTIASNKNGPPGYSKTEIYRDFGRLYAENYARADGENVHCDLDWALIELDGSTKLLRNFYVAPSTGTLLPIEAAHEMNLVPNTEVLVLGGKSGRHEGFIGQKDIDLRVNGRRLVVTQIILHEILGDLGPIQNKKNPNLFVDNHFGIDIEGQIAAPNPVPLLSDKRAADTHIVKFLGPDDPLNPKNWTSRKRWRIIYILAACTYLSTCTSSSVVPALNHIAKDFHFSSTVERQMVYSIFILPQLFGPLLLGPLSEIYGRRIILLSSLIFFLSVTTACGFSKSKQQLLAFRFLSGISGSSLPAIGSGMVGDLFKPERRGKPMGMFGMAVLLGPIIGPIYGSFVAEKTTWRWIFWLASICVAVVLLASVFGLKETYSPYLLHRKARSLRLATGNPPWRSEGESRYDDPVAQQIWGCCRRAFSMFLRENIVRLTALDMSIGYGTQCLIISTIPSLFTTTYKESLGISGLKYISLCLGFLIGTPGVCTTSDKVYAALKRRNLRGHGKPEFRLPVSFLWSLQAPSGLILFGWSAQSRIHWIVPNFGLFLFASGTIATFQRVTTYIVDTYARFAASAVSSVTMVRSLAGFSFPLVAPVMYQGIGYGWGNSVLALILVFAIIPVPIVLWIFGEKMRKKSKHASTTVLQAGGAVGGPDDPGSPDGASQRAE